ncbi:MAG: hypothetical protein SPH02_02230, partial [Campylobacter sp.]|nr:hypothetical protein [Campylobacter sp.]
RNPLDQGASHRKTGQKFLQKGWAAQGFKSKKRRPAGAKQPADAKQKKLSQPIKNNSWGILV